MVNAFINALIQFFPGQAKANFNALKGALSLFADTLFAVFFAGGINDF